MEPVWRRYFPNILVVLLLAAYALAQQRVVITGLNTNGQPSIANVNDAGQLAVQIVPASCTMTQTAVSVDTTVGGTAVPATATANRAYLVLCNSKVNASGLVKCRGDTLPDGGNVPVYASGGGTVLDVGDCVMFSVFADTPAKCIASAGTVVVETAECVPR